MTKSTSPIPAGFHTVTPYLIVQNARKAIDFYKTAFNAEEVLVMPRPDGKIMHAHIKIGDSNIFLSDEMPERDHLGPQSRGGATSSLLLYVKDVDSSFEQAVKAGCTVRMPLANQFWGDRYGNVVDPFGHAWSLASHVEDVDHEEMKRRMETACASSMAASKK
jgi:PhnB protein